MQSSKSVIAIDLAKNVFQVCVLSPSGKVQSNEAIKRDKLVHHIRQKAGDGVIAMEACASSHHWGRLFKDMGFEVLLIPAQHVKPFARTHKSDARDALAIAEACQRPKLHFVQVKSLSQQDLCAAIRVRERLVQQRVAICNQIRGLLAEYGLIAPPSKNKLRTELSSLVENDQLTAVARVLILELYRDWRVLDQRLQDTEALMAELCRPNPAYPRLLEVPGVGPINAAQILAAVGTAKQFKNGRQLAAWAGLVPRQHGSGGKTSLHGITRNGDRGVRTLLIHGARAVLRWSSRRTDALGSWLAELQARRGYNRAVVALANKTARIIYSILAKDMQYDMKLAFATRKQP